MLSSVGHFTPHALRMRLASGLSQSIEPINRRRCGNGKASTDALLAWDVSRKGCCLAEMPAWCQHAARKLRPIGICTVSSSDLVDVHWTGGPAK
jgi:hypothetical protein